MTVESTYLGALPRVDRVAREAADLCLSGDGVELRFVQQPPVPTSASVGDTWVLDTLLSGEVASSAAGGAATLRVHRDGTLTGSTGCRALSGQYVVVGDEVMLTVVAVGAGSRERPLRQDAYRPRPPTHRVVA